MATEKSRRTTEIFHANLKQTVHVKWTKLLDMNIL